MGPVSLSHIVGTTSITFLPVAPQIHAPVWRFSLCVQELCGPLSEDEVK